MQYPYQTGAVTLSNGCTIRYIDEGRGDETILFIHGLANYALCWQKNIEELKTNYRCIALDLPGNGLSDHGDYAYSINFFTGCIAEFAQLLGLRQVHLAGHSMGGQIAINVALNLPEFVSRLVLCAPAGFETFTSMEKAMYQSSISFFDYFSTDENNLKKTIRSSFYHYPQQADGMIDDLVALLQYYPPKMYKRMLDACIAGMLHEPVYDNLHLVLQPTLVMFGERDALIPNRVIHPTTTRSVAEEGTKKMPNARLQMVPNAGHFFQWEQPGLTNELIADFLKES